MKATSSCICNQCGKNKEGVQTGLCIHCGRFGKTNRQLALSWIYSLDIDEQTDLCIKYNDICHLHGRLVSSLTGSEIEKIWKQEFE